MNQATLFPFPASRRRRAARFRALVRQGTAIAMAAALAACATNANVESASGNHDRIERSTLLEMAEDAAARGEYYAAIPMFRRAHVKSSGSARPLIGLGKSLLAVGQYGDAAEVFRMAIGKNSSRADAYHGLGQALLVLGDYTSAADAFRSAAAGDPGNAANYSGEGIALDAGGLHGEALAVFRRAASDFPNNLDIRSNFGLSLAMHGATGEAVEMLEDVVRNPAAQARHRQNLALAYAFAGDIRRAVAMSSIDLDRDGVITNLRYVDILRALPTENRMAAVLGNSAQPDRTYAGYARRGQNDDPWAQAAANRLLTEQVAEMVAPEPTSEEADESRESVALGGVPPLLEPSGWAVQIAAYRKIEHLAPGWRYLSTKYADIIGGLEPRRSEVNHPPSDHGPVGFYYRLNAGPLTSGDEARGICEAIKAAGGECWVRAPEPAEGRLPDDTQGDDAFIISADHNAVMNQIAQAVLESDPGLDLRPLANGDIAAPLPLMETAEAPAVEDAPIEPVSVAASAPRAPLDAPIEPVSVAASAPRAPLDAPIEPVSVAASAPRAPLDAPIEPVSVAASAPRAPLDAPIEPVSVAAGAPRELLDAPIAFGGPEDDSATPVLDSVAADDGDSGPAEQVPASFGQSGLTRIGTATRKPIDVNSAFEAAEGGQFEATSLSFTEGLPAANEPVDAAPEDKAAMPEVDDPDGDADNDVATADGADSDAASTPAQEASDGASDQ